MFLEATRSASQAPFFNSVKVLRRILHIMRVETQRDIVWLKRRRMKLRTKMDKYVQLHLTNFCLFTIWRPAMLTYATRNNNSQNSWSASDIKKEAEKEKKKDATGRIEKCRIVIPVLWECWIRRRVIAGGAQRDKRECDHFLLSQTFLLLSSKRPFKPSPQHPPTLCPLS